MSNLKRVDVCVTCVTPEHVDTGWLSLNLWPKRGSNGLPVSTVVQVQSVLFQCGIFKHIADGSVHTMCVWYFTPCYRYTSMCTMCVCVCFFFFYPILQKQVYVPSVCSILHLYLITNDNEHDSVCEISYPYCAVDDCKHDSVYDIACCSL